ncbi:hypothetical protein DFH28DRAFT_1107942 [Melampsora americana]|nr:hypothetical protein DFH28DRAFT_1107942 [Melampsora americana]
MIFFTRTNTVITFGLFTLVQHGISRLCSKRFHEVNANVKIENGGGLGRWACGNDHDTYSFPYEDCKPTEFPDRPPAGTGCIVNGVKMNGNCPTYYTWYDDGKRACAFQTGPGASDYEIVSCEKYSNLVACKDGNGRYMPDFGNR